MREEEAEELLLEGVEGEALEQMEYSLKAPWRQEVVLSPLEAMEEMEEEVVEAESSQHLLPMALTVKLGVVAMVVVEVVALAQALTMSPIQYKADREELVAEEVVVGPTNRV